MTSKATDSWTWFYLSSLLSFLTRQHSKSSDVLSNAKISSTFEGKKQSKVCPWFWGNLGAIVEVFLSHELFRERGRRIEKLPHQNGKCLELCAQDVRKLRGGPLGRVWEYEEPSGWEAFKGKQVYGEQKRLLWVWTGTEKTVERRGNWRENSGGQWKNLGETLLPGINKEGVWEWRTVRS